MFRNNNVGKKHRGWIKNNVVGKKKAIGNDREKTMWSSTTIEETRLLMVFVVVPQLSIVFLPIVNDHGNNNDDNQI